MDFQSPALTFAVALAVGVFAQSVGRHLRVPGIVFLLAAGVLLGPQFADVVRPDTLGPALQPIVGLAVAVVLFEGGLNLNVGRLRREALTIRRLITLGALITLAGGMTVSLLLVGWGWQTALLFGTLVVVTGPTVINPITRRIRVKRNLETILEAEGVLIDPIGAILAVLALEIVLETTAQGAASGLLGFAYRFGIGSVLGAAGGFLIGFLLRFHDVVPTGYENIFTLSAVLALFATSNAVLPESGIMTVAIAGLVVGNMETRVARELVEFKEQLTILLVGLLFVLLSAAVPLEDLIALGWPGLATVAALILVVRPLNVAASTMGSELDLRERAFLSWLAPRGIVAFAISSLFAVELADHGMATEGAQLRALVFLVIAVTVVLQGTSAGLVGRWLGVRMPGARGHLLIGANPLGRALGHALEEAGEGEEQLVLIDTNANEARAAEAEGFRVVFGNAAEERTMRRAHAEGHRNFVAVTPNQGVNLLLANRALDLYRIERRFVALDARSPGVVREQVLETGARLLFGRDLDFERWNHDLLQGNLRVERFRREVGGRAILNEERERSEVGDDVLPLVRARGGRANPVSERTEVRKGDDVVFAWPETSDDEVRAWLSASGWRPVAGAGQPRGEVPAAAPT